MKNKRKRGLIGLLFFIVIGGLVTDVGTVRSAGEQKFTQEELVSLSRPAVVRIVQKVKGEIIIKPFALNMDNLTISARAGGAKKIPVDDYMTGSGFIVSEDGYILTNSHVVSRKEISNQYVADVATSAIMDASLTYLGANPDLNDATKMEAFEKKLNDYLLQESTFNLQQNTVVLDPSSRGEKIDDLIAEGLPISVISENYNYSTDGWDMALIKINQKNLPTLPLGGSASIKRGETIGVFGFPTTAELNGKNPLESTFSQGVVSAIKNSENKDFDIIQTDAKVSSGSSGSPLLNAQGEVIGMITYQTNKMDSLGGDNFAFAIPIDVVQDGIKKFNLKKTDIQFNAGNYFTQFSSGLGLMHEEKCKAALVAFENAKNTNDKFDASVNVQPYLKKCHDLISTGQSVDTKWDRAKKMLISLDGLVWAVVALVILLFIVIVIRLFTMKKRLKKDEKEIVLLEEELKQNEERDLDELKEIRKIEEELDKLRKK